MESHGVNAVLVDKEAVGSMNNVASKNLDQHLDDGGIQQLHVLIKKLKYRDIMDVKYLLNYVRENEATLELLSDEQIIENIMGNDKEDEVKDDSFILEPVSCKDTLKATITLYNFLLKYENTTPELFNALKKVRDEVQGDINFKRK
ncbi:hypothetical protein QQP08_018605 [Theobroma cacao]|nr:hypothetical protein QQP08_018605 [Theobroma cacao]